MMLYVFHVDVGRMMTFDMTVALSSVENLKETIERLHGIPSKNIVLLVSGGEMLTHATQVSYYSAGTDTNPIYMFLTGDIKLPSSLPQIDTDAELLGQIDRCLELPAVYETVMTRAQLALRLHDLAREEERLCDRLVHEQHLQQQGWSGVVANLEDLTDEFRDRFTNFCIAFDGHLEKRSTYLQLLRNFGDDLTKLELIPILPGLMPLAEQDFHGFDEFLDNDDIFSRSTTQQESVLMMGGVKCNSGDNKNDESTSNFGEEKNSTSPNKKLKMAGDNILEEGNTISQSSTTSNNARRRNLNLLQWITSRENHNTLKLMSDECIQGLGTFNDKIYEELKKEIENIIVAAGKMEVKEIKGLGERLCKLDEFKYKIKNMVQDQKELSTAFQQNQNRAINLRDKSILPDLCASHRSQLLVMQQNHIKIREHRRLIAKAKEELGTNLHFRLKRIVLIENTMSDFDSRLLFYHRCLRRAERHINIIEQIHQAPNIYIAAVTEVVRRRIFSGEFRMWASKLAEDFETIHSEEIRRRQLFNSSFEGHFLNILFPGMNDMPPAFANENPLIFDARLPNLTKSDIDILASNLPDLAKEICLPDMVPVINFFVSRSGDHQMERMEQLLKAQMAVVLDSGGSCSGSAEGGNVVISETNEKPLQHQRLNELLKTTGCDESETDTETEFEKVSHSENQNVATWPSENNIIKNDIQMVARSTTTDQLLSMQNAETLTDETELSARTEVERMRTLLGVMSRISLDCIRKSRVELNSILSDTEAQQADLKSQLEMIKDQCKLLHKQYAEKEDFAGKRFIEKENEIKILKDSLNEQIDEMKEYRERTNDELTTMHVRYATLEAQMEELRDKLKASDMEKEAAVASARDELIHEHKTEIESLRCRFKLMTSMERSPSDSSLERIERPTSTTSEPNVIDLAQHEAILTQLRSTLELEKKQALERAISKAKKERYMMQPDVGSFTYMLEHKQKQLEQLREKDVMLTKENYQLKSRLDALTNEDGNSWLQEKIEYLKNDKYRLEEELSQEKLRRIEMETSVAAIKNSTYEQVRSKPIGAPIQKCIVLDSCTKGDIVFIVWSVRHGQFMVVQDSQSLYFVHADSLAGLNLRLPTTSKDGNEGTSDDHAQIPMPYYAIGRVVDKEYCQAKKDENRYRVTRGSKFYRIKIAPLTSQTTTRRERLESFSASISHSMSQCESSESSAGQMKPTDTSSGIKSGRSTSKDVIDGAINTNVIKPVHNVAPTTNVGPTISKERTISITSVAEEEYEQQYDLGSLLAGERCRSISINEDDKAMESPLINTPPITTTSSDPVITEQPTLSNKLNIDLLLKSPDIVMTPPITTFMMPSIQEQSGLVSSSSSLASSTTISSAPAISTTTTTTSISSQQTIVSTVITSAVAAIEEEDKLSNQSGLSDIDLGSFVSPTSMPLSMVATITELTTETLAPTVTGTSEDSDEYRSLEGKDEVEEIDFTLTA